MNALETGYQQSDDFVESGEFGENNKVDNISPKIKRGDLIHRIPRNRRFVGTLLSSLFPLTSAFGKISSNLPNSLRYFYPNFYGEISSNLPFSLLRAFLDVSDTVRRTLQQLVQSTCGLYSFLSLVFIFTLNQRYTISSRLILFCEIFYFAKRNETKRNEI